MYLRQEVKLMGYDAFSVTYDKVSSVIVRKAHIEGSLSCFIDQFIMMKNTSTKERKKGIKATRATAEPEVDNADCSEDLITATQPEENKGIEEWRIQSTDDWGAKNKNDKTMTTKVKESNKRCKHR